jgi:large subunit ribosomal protein L22
MTGPKLNEAPARRPNGARPSASDRRGTRAVVRYARISPYKVRAVLDLVRGHDVERAQEILRFCERDAAIIVGKALGSAVANAETNDSIDPDDLYVSACFADEGPTLKRWRPRARGRATRIRKRTCHVTVIVSRLPEDELERRRREGSAGDRARRRAGQERARRRRRGDAQAEQAPAEETAVEEASPVAEQAPLVEDAAAPVEEEAAPVEEEAAAPAEEPVEPAAEPVEPAAEQPEGEDG